MTRRTGRWGDDDRDDPDDRPRRGGPDTRALTVAAIILGGLFVACAAVCGGIAWLGHRNVERARLEAEVEARRAVEEARQADAVRAARPAAGDRPDGDEDGIPPPKPGRGPVADPPPQPPPAAFASDRAGDPGRWVLLFRSKNPALWNTSTWTADDFARPLRGTPPDTRYLRLRRMDTGDAIIIPMIRGRVARADPPGQGPTVRWNGRGDNEHGGYHLGIAEGPAVKWTEGKGTVAVLMDGWDANPGSGFGHAHHVDNGGQRFAWLGKEIPPVAFEVAVTAAELTDAEKKWLKE